MNNKSDDSIAVIYALLIFGLVIGIIATVSGPSDISMQLRALTLILTVMLTALILAIVRLRD